MYGRLLRDFLRALKIRTDSEIVYQKLADTVNEWLSVDKKSKNERLSTMFGLARPAQKQIAGEHCETPALLIPVASGKWAAQVFQHSLAEKEVLGAVHPYISDLKVLNLPGKNPIEFLEKKLSDAVGYVLEEKFKNDKYGFYKVQNYIGPRAVRRGFNTNPPKIKFIARKVSKRIEVCLALIPRECTSLEAGLEFVPRYELSNEVKMPEAAQSVPTLTP